MQTTERPVIDPALQETVDRFNDLRQNKKAEWLGLLNTIRYYELRGSGFLSYVAEILEDPDMMYKMTKHAADEGKHAHFLNLMIRREGGQPSPNKGPQAGPSTPPVGGTPSREVLIGIFAGMQAIERRAAHIFAAFEHVFADDPVILSMVREVIKDEKFHINWIAKVLEKWRAEGYQEQIDSALGNVTASYNQATAAQAAQN